MNSLNKSLIVINYFCHECNKSTDILTANQTCNRCNSGFVEEITVVPKDDDEVSQQMAKSELKDKNEESMAEPMDELMAESMDDCSICLLTLDKTKEKVIQLVCHHSFHKPCIKEWFKQASSCPLCRGKVDVPSFITPIKPMDTLDTSDLLQTYLQIRSRSPISHSTRIDSRGRVIRGLRPSVDRRPRPPVDRRPRWVP